MKIRITKKTRRILILYLAALVILYIVIFQVPKVSEKFETTQVLENGTLEVSCEATGYLVKDEAICTAGASGDIEYKVSDGTVVKKGTKIASIKEDEAAEEQTAEGAAEESAVDGKYEKYLEQLKGFDLLCESTKAPVSGVLSMSMDGCEKYLSIGNLDNIKKEEVEALDFSQQELEREHVNKGEPIFKVSSDDNWYIITWVEKADAKKYEDGEKVRITIGESNMDARVDSIKKDGEFYRMVFYLNVYYEDFCTAREVDMNVVQSNTVGLIVDNECIIEKNGQEGVYVKTKDGDTYFKPIKVKITDGKQSVIYESIYVNDEYEQVETVSVYQEVLRHPQEALEEDMAKE